MKIPLKVKLLAVFSNALICPIGFILAVFFLYLIPPLGSINYIWFGLIITALPQAAIALRLRRRINDEYELGARKYVSLRSAGFFVIVGGIFADGIIRQYQQRHGHQRAYSRYVLRGNIRA